MKILAIGDVVGNCGLSHLQTYLWKVRNQYKPDLVIANGENVSNIRGISHVDAGKLLDAGVDLITLGNHTYGMRDIYEYLESESRIIRPANYPPSAPGSGYTIVNVSGWRLLCVNMLGTAFMDALANPFETMEKILSREQGRYDCVILDMHAESTSEKIAMGREFDGRIAVVFGTHTHVPTADIRILPKGTGFISDLGMTGAIESILGAEIDPVLEKFKSHMPCHILAASGDAVSQGAIFEIDASHNRCLHAERIEF